MSRPGLTRGIGGRLFVAQTVVLLAGVSTAGLVAAVLGPQLFHDHLVQAGHLEDATLRHIDEAYASSNLASLSTALLTALIFAVAVTWYVTRRITKPLHALSDAAHAVAQGEQHVRVTDTGQGAEIDTLGRSFNHMAQQIETTEATRRRLLTDIAHELRTPLASLAARLEGLEDGVTEWDPHALRVFRSQVDRLTRLANDLSEVSRAEEHRLTIRPEVIDISTVVRATADSARGAFVAKNVSLDVHTPDDSHAPHVLGDPERLGQLLQNLLSNALRHTPPNGSVTLNVTSSNGHVTITVQDTGEGIPPERSEQVFERFYRGDSARHADGRGSGVGLTIARGIAESHGGTLRALDGAERGATFLLELPRWRGERDQH